ncbi:MAG: hypothetical protein ACXQTO_05355 [Candidatus Syntropharchaeales archaeon]
MMRFRTISILNLQKNGLSERLISSRYHSTIIWNEQNISRRTA